MSIYDKASLVLIPSGTKTSKVYSQKPVNGDGDFTFSRSTAATRVNASGNIEKETMNLVPRSNDFSAWSKAGNASVTSGQAGYDGTNDAWLATSDSTAQNYQVYRGWATYGVQTFSIYAKANTATIFLIDYAIPDNGYVRVDLTDGSVVAESGASNFIRSNVEDVGNGWYRISVTANVTNSTYIRAGAYSTAGSVYIQDAQVEQGLVARDYIETTTAAVYGGITDNVPRLDYTDSSCPALLLEPQRTNGITASEYFDGSNLNNTTISAEYNTADTLSPEGVYNAAKLTATGNFPRYYDFPTIGNNVDVSLSVFAKQGDASVFTIRGNDKSNTAFVVNFDLANGTAELSQFDSLEPTFDIQPFGNGWYRCIVNTNSGSGATAFQIRPISHAQGETGGWSGSNYIYAYGVQYEASASYATSYIPTYGTSVTRNQDLCYITNLKNDVTTGATEGSVMIDFTRDGVHSTGDAIQVYGDTSNGRGYVYNTGVGFASNWGLGAFNISYGTDYKVLYRLNTLSTGNIFLNGSKSSDASGSSWGSINAIYLRGSFGTLKIRQVLVSTTALTDQEAIDLTTI